MKKNQTLFHRNWWQIADKINAKCQTFMTDIKYKEYLHNVEYENGICYCINRSERRISFSEIEKCRYKNRIQVIMVVAKRLTKSDKRKINQILKTNVVFEDVKKTYTKIIFNVNPHKM